MKNIQDVGHLDGVKVLVRLDLNVPIENGVIKDDYRIQKSLPLITYLYDKRANLILISHIETKENPTLAPVAKYLNDVGIECVFEKNYKKVAGNSSRIILLENLREYEGEKKNDKKFAQELASLADIYVNEAFSVSHREHASVCAVTEFLPSYAGLQFQEEILNLSKAFNPPHPFVFVLGGAKFDTKLPLVEKFMNLADKVCIGGALANDFFKAQGKDVGTSLVSNPTPDLTPFISSPKIAIPIDTVVKDTSILDVGLNTIEEWKKDIDSAKIILWNGTMGAYEMGYTAATLKLAQYIAEATKKGAISILGGGDTIASIKELNLHDSFTFISTGGGAMLDFLADGTLPGIEALKKSKN